MTEKEVIDIFGKSIWDMTPIELVDNNLDALWVMLVDKGEN